MRTLENKMLCSGIAMPIQAGNQNSISLLQKATFGSFIKLYYTHFFVFARLVIFFGKAVLHPLARFA